MTNSYGEINKRKTAAVTAIRNAYGTEEDECGGTLFISHHLNEIEKSYWLKHIGTDMPEPIRIIDMLVLRSYWGEEEWHGLDTFDFTLPDEITNYVISVHFDKDGQVDEISMES